MSEAITINVNISTGEPKHNVGVLFNAAGMGKAREYQFPARSRLSRKVMKSNELAREIRTRLFFHKSDVQNHEWQPNDKFHTFIWDLPWEVTFGDTLDLGMSLGDTDIVGKMYAKVRRKDLKLVQLKVSGKVKDLYNWDYGIGGYDRRAARVQAGYNTLGNAGHIYKVWVYLKGKVKLRYNFR